MRRWTHLVVDLLKRNGQVWVRQASLKLLPNRLKSVERSNRHPNVEKYRSQQIGVVESVALRTSAVVWS